MPDNDYQLLRSFKNEADYFPVYDLDVFYNMAFLDT